MVCWLCCYVSLVLCFVDCVVMFRWCCVLLIVLLCFVGVVIC